MCHKQLLCFVVMVSDEVHMNYNADITVVLEKLVCAVWVQLLQLKFLCIVYKLIQKGS